MRVNVDEMALREPRIRRLAKKLTINHYEALGRIMHVWMLCYHRRCAVVAPIDIDIAADLDGFAEAMASEDLATPDDGGLYVRGVSERIGFLEKQADKGRKSGESRRSKSQTNQRSNHHPNQPRTTVEPRFGSGSTTTRTYSPDLDQDQAHALDQDLDLRTRTLPQNGERARHVVTVDGNQSTTTVDTSQLGPSPDHTGTEKASPRANGRVLQGIANPIPDPPQEAQVVGFSLLEYVVRNHPDSKLARAPQALREVTALKWADEIRKLHAIDGISYTAITAMVHWCQRDKFWIGVVTSAEKLRKNWDQMAAQRTRGSKVIPVLAKGDERKRREEIERERQRIAAQDQAAAEDRDVVRAALREAGFVPPDPIPDLENTDAEPEPVGDSHDG